MNFLHRYLRYIPLVLLSFVILHFISFPLLPQGTGKSERDVNAPQFSPVDNSGPHSTVLPPEPPVRANATFVTLARNKDLRGIIQSIKHVEERFNHNYHYDWVFLNDKEFDEEFKKNTTEAVSGNAYYGLIPKEHWSYPDWIDKKKAAATRKDMKERKIIYGGSASYRHMCRYESGFFFRHPLMLNYDYYWRVEPDVEYHCDVPYDPFKVLRDNGKKYSFVISMHEYEKTIPTLWDSTKRFMANHTEYIVEGNSLDFISNDGGDSYNLCHFWSNFEIGDLNWLRSQPYLDYFNHLDQEGGFFYERWGDAPVHSIAASLMLKKEEIHFFDDIAYTHRPFTHCPTSRQKQIELRCSCDSKSNFDWKPHSCTSRFFKVNNMPKPRGYVLQTKWFATLVKVFWYTVLVLSIVTGICSTPFIRRRIIAFAHPFMRIPRDELYDWRWAKA